MKPSLEYPLNPDCKPPAVSGRKITDKWYVYFFYYENGLRKQYRRFSGLNVTGQSLSQKKHTAKLIIDELDELLRTRTFNKQSKTFDLTLTESSLVNDLIDKYLTVIKPRVVYHTYANYNTAFKSIKSTLEGLSVSEVTKELLQAYFRRLDVKPQSKRSYKIYISTFFNWLKDENGFNVNNPTIGIKLPNNVPVERHKVYSKEDISKIVDYCDQYNEIILKTIIYLIYGAQIRISEILKIQMMDFKLKENKIVLPKGKGKVKNKIKNVLIDEPLKQFLLSLNIDFETLSDSKLYFIGNDKTNGKRKFLARYPLANSTIQSKFQKLKKELNIDVNKTLYSFKHTGNVNLLLNGADLIELMYKNGHSKISQTETYARQLIEQVPEMKYIRKTREDIDFK